MTARLSTESPVASANSWIEHPRKGPGYVCKPSSPAVAAAYAAMEVRARRTALALIKTRARSYQRAPWQLGALADGLETFPPRQLVTAIAYLIRTQRPLRWVGFGGEVPAITLRGAMLYARFARAKVHHRARRAA